MPVLFPIKLIAPQTAITIKKITTRFCVLLGFLGSLRGVSDSPPKAGKSSLIGKVSIGCIKLPVHGVRFWFLGCWCLECRFRLKVVFHRVLRLQSIQDSQAVMR